MMITLLLSKARQAVRGGAGTNVEYAISLRCLGAISLIAIGVLASKIQLASTFEAHRSQSEVVSIARGQEALSQRIAALLADDTYLKSDSKGTTKNAGIGFRGKTKDGSIVEVSYCLVKGNVFLRVVDSTGKVLKYGDCRGFRDDKQAPLRSLAAEAFPDDAEVQKHKPKQQN